MTATMPIPVIRIGFEQYFAARHPVGGVPIVATTTADAAVAICSTALGLQRQGGSGEHVHLASAQTIALAATRPPIDATLNGTGWVLPDGKPISWVSRFRGDSPVMRQTRGLEVFNAVCDLGRRYGIRHYLLGSTPDTLAAMEANLRLRYPGIQIAGMISPPFRPPTPDELVQRDAAIAASGAHVVWVGLGTPKQDFEVQRLAERLPVVALAVGAVFDFTAGTLQVAPGWVSRLGLEWLYRLIAEPRRLWRRYTVDSAGFVLAVLRHGVRPRGGM